MGIEETESTTAVKRRPPRMPRPDEGERLAAISNMAVKVFADHMGRGPTKVRSYVVDDIVVCLLEDTMTKAERELMKSGNSAILLKTRSIFQQMMRPDLSAGIEALTGRRVIAFTSGNDVDADIFSELFVLGGPNGHEPRGA
jgi:uncharacterized protein YbcI